MKDDRLQQMMEKQALLQIRLNRDIRTWEQYKDATVFPDPVAQYFETLPAKQRFWFEIRKDVEAMRQELAELTDCFPWKHWRPAEAQPFDLQNAKVEVVDLLHFLFNIAMKLGLGPQGLFELYIGKNEVNHARQDNGYHVKDHEDCRHLGTGAEK